MSPPTTIKCVLVGDINAGKTSLLHTYATGRRPSAANTDLCELPKIVHVNAHHLNTAYDLQLFDTNGCLSQLPSRITAYAAYRDPHVVLVCADLTEPTAWPRLETTWRTELADHVPPHVPLVVAGTKVESRDAIQKARAAGSGDVVTTERGRRAASRLAAAAYRECSVVTGAGVATIFSDALEAALHPERKMAASRPRSVLQLWDKLTAR